MLISSELVSWIFFTIKGAVAWIFFYLYANELALSENPIISNFIEGSRSDVFNIGEKGQDSSFPLIFLEISDHYSNPSHDTSLVFYTQK